MEHFVEHLVEHTLYGMYFTAETIAQVWENLARKTLENADLSLFIIKNKPLKIQAFIA